MTLAKGLTGAHLPLGAVVVNENVARHLETQMLFTGLTYSGHPLTCAAGLAAIRAYEDEKLIERSRRLGSAMLLELKRLQQQHRLIGDVRGGHGLFAIVELVSDPISREPLAPWPQTPPQLTTLVQKARALGVSFAVRGNLIILAPPLVIEERELSDALALLDRLLSEMESA
jgi:taurine---2-oxoglutarate transaminase